MLLCDAVARGLIQPLCGPDSFEIAPQEDKGKKRAEKGMQKATSVHGISLDPAALQEVRKALEVCLCVAYTKGAFTHGPFACYLMYLSIGIIEVFVKNSDLTLLSLDCITVKLVFDLIKCPFIATSCKISTLKEQLQNDVNASIL